jgi:hypothetical protein
VWNHLLSGFTVPLAAASDDAVIDMCLEGLRTSIHIACLCLCHCGGSKPVPRAVWAIWVPLFMTIFFLIGYYAFGTALVVLARHFLPRRAPAQDSSNELSIGGTLSETATSSLMSNQATPEVHFVPNESFTFEAEASIDKQPSGAPIEPVPMGLPVQTEPQVPIGIPVPMAAQPVPMGAPVTSAAPVPSASRSGAVSGAAALPAQLGVVPSVGTALAAMSLARELGVTPQNAWVAAHQGARLAKDLGVTPSAAASAGIAAMNLLAEMQKESISKTARRT